MTVLALMVAGAVGAVLRLVADHYLPTRGILLVNVLGSLIAGLATGLLSDLALDVWLSGVAGALTTFSTVSVSTARDMVAGRFWAAAASWTLHLGGGLVAVVVGLALGLGW